MQGTDATFDEVSFEGGDSSRRVLQKVLPGAAAVALAGAVGVWALHLRESAAPDAGTPRSARWPRRRSRVEVLRRHRHRRRSARRIEARRACAGFVASGEPRSRSALFLAADPAAEPRRVSARSARPRKPEARPCRRRTRVPKSARARPCRRLARRSSALPRQPAVRSNRTWRPLRPPPQSTTASIFQKLFGLGQPSAPAGRLRVAPQGGVASRAVASVSAATESASAATESRGAGRGPLVSFPSPFGGSAPVSGYDRNTAVYDISARTVYLPDGTKLEAHSGLGDALDDPRYVSERARGPTPPHLYQLALREGSFHGVQALRLNPVGEGGLYGRAGLLAHPFMLGPNGDSNGCVSVKDYDAFLRAYENGQINKLAVVAKL